jgi:fucose permease
VLQSRRQRAALILITFVAFISLGLPDGLLDIANPRIRAAFDIGPDVFSLIFLTGLTGYFLSSCWQQCAGSGNAAASCLATALALIGNAVARPGSGSWCWD